jgi:hypothetical protein
MVDCGCPEILLQQTKLRCLSPVDGSSGLPSHGEGQLEEEQAVNMAVMAVNMAVMATATIPFVAQCSQTKPTLLCGPLLNQRLERSLHSGHLTAQTLHDAVAAKRGGPCLHAA